MRCGALRSFAQTHQKQLLQMKLMAENVLQTGKENKELLGALAQLKHRFEYARNVYILSHH